MVSEAEFVRLWVQLSPEAERALEVSMSCSPDAADGRTPADVLTLVERVVDEPEIAGLTYGLTASDLHDLIAAHGDEGVPVGTLLRAAAEESSSLGGVTIDPVHLLLGVLAFDSLYVTRELAWGGITYERARRWARRWSQAGRRASSR